MGMRRAPSHYPPLPFHLIRTIQHISCLIVAGIILFFIIELARDALIIPWTFIILLAVCIATIASIWITLLIHCCSTLNPVISLFLSAVLSLKWTIAMGFLAWNASYTLGNACDFDNWGEEGQGGRYVCRLYKVLFAFTVVGFVSTLCALALDIHVRNKQTRLGTYNQMQNFDHKRTASEDPWFAQPSQISVQPKGGYEMPLEQYNYDTAYRGGHRLA